MEIPSSPIHSILVRQLVKSGTSVGANYRSACRAKSNADMISKLKVVEEDSTKRSIGLKSLKSYG